MNNACYHKESSNQATTPRNLAEPVSGDGITKTDPPLHPSPERRLASFEGRNTTETSVVLKDPTGGVQPDGSTAPSTTLYPGIPKGTPFGASVRQSTAPEVSE